MNTLLTIILAFLGIIASVIITRHYTRKQMAKNQISHLLLKSYDIGDGLREIFPNLQILYNGNDLEKYTRVVKGNFNNTGNKDIHSNDDLELSLIFPDNFAIKDIKVVPSTEDLEISTEIDKENKNKVHFFIKKLIRSGEYFSYIAILDSTEYNNNPFDGLRFSNRIPNTSVLDEERERDRKGVKKSIITFIIALIIFAIYYFWGKSYLIEGSITRIIINLLVGFIIGVLLGISLSEFFFVRIYKVRKK